jgi:hypothetical protein
MHLYALNEETIELVLRNYTKVFPHVSVWVTQSRDLLLLGFDTPERALDIEALERRYERPDFKVALKRAGLDSFPALLSRELLPLGTLHAFDLEGPFHTLRHPLLSDMAARAFVVGGDVALPKFAAPEAAAIGFRNSLLRRYVGGQKGSLPGEIFEIAIREACKVQLVPECVTLMAAWWQSDPESEALNALVNEIRSTPSYGPAFAEGNLASVVRLFGGQPLLSLKGPRSLARAQQLSGLYRAHYHHVVPFDRGVLRTAWGNCSAKDCEKAQRKVEKDLGKIGKPGSRDVPLRRPRAGRPALDEEAGQTDRDQFPESR